MAEKSKFLTCDGNYAAAHVAYMFSEVSAIYPITPSSTMAEYIDEWASYNRKNIFGDAVKVVEMQSEAGAAGAVHGALQAGALTTTYTASQGLLLMIPNMYKISGELLPGVFHVSARALAAQALSIFGDHSDVMSTRQTGFAMLATGSVQEIMDIAPIAHLAAISGRVPFLHFFDGFRTSHEIQKVEPADQEKLKEIMPWDALNTYRQNALNPENPVTRGTAQNPDIYFQSREAANKFYDVIPDLVEDYMQKIKTITGREYHPFTYYGASDATNIVVAMGSITETIRETIDYLIAKGEKIGLVTCHLYRPFSAKYFFNVLPKSVKRLCVLDRTKEIGANGDPLYLDVVELYNNMAVKPMIIGGRYGLSSKDTTPAHMVAVFENLKMNEPKNQFTVGIVDDVTFKSLPILPDISVVPEGTYEAKFYGLGSDGTVGANKNSIKIIGGATDKYCQAYFAYDSKKSGGFTTSHLRFGNKPIRAPYLVNSPDFVACHVPSYLDKYDMLKGLKKGGIFLLNSIWSIEDTIAHLPNSTKKYLADNNISMYIINATAIAEELGLGNRTNTIMQSAFFKVSEVIPYEFAVEQMKKAIVKSYGSKGEKVIAMNNSAVDRGGDVTKVEVDANWSKLTIPAKAEGKVVPAFIRDVVEPMNAQEGDNLPVSAFLGREDGTFPAGTTQYEKRGIAVNVPEWIESNCIQCNQCAYVCPHAAIRPFLLDEADLAGAPAGTKTIKANGKAFEGLQFRIQVSTLDCTGCSNCADICPAKTKALVMKPLESQHDEIARWDYMHYKVGYKENLVDKTQNMKSSQFVQPLFEFSGACAGCGETPYIKAITQLFGERMTVANATGCSSIFGGSAPATPYTVNQKSGRGPAWANSLFEDNAEFGLGMAVATEKLRQRIFENLTAELDGSMSADTKEAIKNWISNMHLGEASVAPSNNLIACLEKENNKIATDVLALKHYLIKKSHWIFGGDGWAYDIGYGGLDHVLASGEDVNILVLDTEVYSNTGGQASKSTPAAAVAKFATSGKPIRKKDLGMMAMSYGYVYVAQVAMNASQSQYFNVLKEAEAFPGPSIVIAYAPCINHGLALGMGKTQAEEKLAVECGYWSLWRYNPQLEVEGKNPFVIDSKDPDWAKFQTYIRSEVRFTSLAKTFPDRAEMLYKLTEDNAKWRYKQYSRLVKADF
ncbi:MAG: pyruvate:ferredoxin (flavodoxin) oxidoreductase [Bacteroidota bacterium]